MFFQVHKRLQTFLLLATSYLNSWYS